MPSYIRPHQGGFESNEEFAKRLPLEYLSMLRNLLEFIDCDFNNPKMAETVLLAYFKNLRERVDETDEFNKEYPRKDKLKCQKADFLHKLKKILNAPRLKTLVKKGLKEKVKSKLKPETEKETRYIRSINGHKIYFH